MLTNKMAEYESKINSASGAASGLNQELNKILRTQTEMDALSFGTEKYIDAMNQLANAGGMSGTQYGVKKHHGGLDSGFVGGLKGNEEFIKALKGEVLVTPRQQNDFMNRVLPSISNNSNSSTMIDTFMKINVEGNLDNSVIPKIEGIVNQAVDKINNAMFKKGFNRMSSTVSI